MGIWSAEGTEVGTDGICYRAGGDSVVPLSNVFPNCGEEVQVFLSLPLLT